MRVLLVVAIVGLASALIMGGAVVGAIAEETDEPANATVSTVLQSSAADTQNAIGEGLFEAEYDTADAEHQSSVVTDRTEQLETQLADLETEREELREHEDELSNGQYQARMATLSAEMAGLERSIDRTKPRAAESGADQERLETLQTNASELAGPDVAAVARETPGQERIPGEGLPDDGDTGPPDNGDAGPPGDGDDTGPPDNGDAGPPGDGDDTGPPGDGDTGPPDNGDTGPPDK